MKKLSIWILTTIGILTGVAFSQGNLPTAAEKIIVVGYSVCPVTGNPVKADIAEVFEGKLYRFCSSACLEQFHENPKGVIGNIKRAKELILTITNFVGELPIYCRITGKPAVKRAFRIFGDFITFYCCSDCREGEMKAGAVDELGMVEENQR